LPARLPAGAEPAPRLPPGVPVTQPSLCLLNLSLKEAPQALKAKLQEALKVKGSWDKARQDIQALNSRVQAITADQKRVRENLRETPKESPLFQRYLKTLEEQEKEMDDLSARLKALHGDEAKAKAAYDDFLANLSAE